MGATFYLHDRLERQRERLASATDVEVREELLKLVRFIEKSGKGLRIRDGCDQDWSLFEESYPFDKWHIVQGRSLSRLEFHKDCPKSETLLLTFELAGYLRSSDY